MSTVSFGKKWTPDEEAFLKQNKHLTNRELAVSLNRSYASVKRKMDRNSVRDKSEYTNQNSIGGLQMECTKHKGYEGLKPPKASCPTCWYMYFVKHKEAAPRLPVSDQVRNERQVIQTTGELADLRKKYKELLKERNVQDRILEFNAKAITALPAVKAPKALTSKDRHTVESAVLVGSCWHIGEVINKQQMGGLNEYNFDIFCRRLQFLIERTIKFTTANMSNHAFDELHVFLTGDMVSGIIHDELIESNDLNIVEQAHLGSLVTAQAFLELAQAFPKVIVTCVVGNHGRVKQQKYFKNKQQVNWDYVFYNNLALLLQNQKNITFNIPLSFFAGVTIKGQNFLVMHGDLVKSWGGIPFYGLNREVSKWVAIKASQKDFFQYFVGSHFHTTAELQTPTGANILNGSLKGGDEYAAGLGLWGDPIQVLFGVHKDYGKTWKIDIKAQYGDNIPNRYKFRRDLSLSDQLPK